jgi:RHS repeat-associated protein
MVTPLPVVLEQSVLSANITYAYGLGLISESSHDFDDFYQYDGLGSVVGLTDSRGGLEARYEYSAWGQTVRPPSSANFDGRDTFRFTGQAVDAEDDLYYLRARYYDPSVGRFLTADRQFGLARVPISQNRYSYAYNNPVRFTDPSGNIAGFDDAFIFGVAALANSVQQLARGSGLSGLNEGEAIAAGIEADAGYNCGLLAGEGGPVASVIAGSACSAGVSTAADILMSPQPVTATAASENFVTSFSQNLITGSIVGGLPLSPFGQEIVSDFIISPVVSMLTTALQPGSAGSGPISSGSAFTSKSIVSASVPLSIPIGLSANKVK